MSAAARTIVEKLDAEERARGRSFTDDENPIFVPSEPLKAFIFIALEAAEMPVRNFETCGWMAPPDVSNILGIWYTPRVVSKPIDPAEVSRQREKLTAGSLRELERQAAERQAQEHAEAIKEKTAQIEKFKRQWEADREAAKVADAQKAAEKTKREQDALAALDNQKSPAPKAAELPKKSNEPNK